MKNSRAFRTFGSTITACTLLAGILFPSAALFAQPVCVNYTSGRQSRKANIAFEENLGQFNPKVVFAGRGNGQTVFLTGDEATFVMPMPETRPVMEDRSADPVRRKEPPHEIYALRMKFEGAFAKPDTVFENELPGIRSYFKGSDPSRWVTGVPRYGRVTQKELYRGIDISWYENNDGRMEFDLIVGPKADPADIDLTFRGADRLSVDDEGNLLIETPAGTLRQDKPTVYQVSNGSRQAVDSGYEIIGESVRFALGSYDRSKTLVIDPPAPLVYSTYIGGNSGEIVNAVSVGGSSGNDVFVAGSTGSTDLPITYGVNKEGVDAFVAKLFSGGNDYDYLAILSGAGDDYGYSMTADSNGAAYVTGYTVGDFPTTWIAYDKTHNGINDVFVTKVNPTGTGLTYSTYLGGSQGEAGYSIALDSTGSAYVTGTTFSANYPLTSGAYDPTLAGTEGFVTKLSPGGNSLSYSTFLGGNYNDAGKAITVDPWGRAYITGSGSQGFPVTSGAHTAPQSNSTVNCFVTKLAANGTSALYSALIGGSLDDGGMAIAIDSNGEAFITGWSKSTNYPIVFGAPDNSLGGATQAAIVTKLNSTGAGLMYSTYLAGNDAETIGSAIAVDYTTDIYVTGWTSSSTFPVTADAYDSTFNGVSDVFLAKMPDLPFSGIDHSTYFGGSGTDFGIAMDLTTISDPYVVGYTDSTDFPVTPGAMRTTKVGPSEGFLSCFSNDWLGE